MSLENLPLPSNLKQLKSKVIAVVAADLHLDDGNWIGSGVEGDSHWSFRYVSKMADQLNVPRLLLGDVIDVKRPSSATLDFLRAELATARQPTYYIEGQHEMTDPPWLQVVGANTVNLNSEQVKLSGVTISGLSWTPADRLADSLAAIPKNTDVVLLHQVWEEFMGSLTSPEGSLRTVPHAKLALTGDYHKYKAIRVMRLQGGILRVYSPGATHLRKISEPSDHYLLVLCADLSVTPVQIPTRRVIRLVFKQQSQVDDLLANLEAYEARLGWLKPAELLPPELHRPLFRITCDEKLAANYDALAERLEGRYHLFWKCVAEDRPEDAESLAASRHFRRLGPSGCLNQVVPDDSEDFKSLTRLLNSPDQRAELQAMKKERGL